MKILKIDDLLDCVFSSKALISNIAPSLENNIDIDLGIKAIRHFAKFDVGQALIVAQKQIIAVEALEVTDEMISRFKIALRSSSRVSLSSLHFVFSFKCTSKNLK